MGWVANASPAVNAKSNWPTITSICVVLSICSILVVTCRLHVRSKARGLAADDYLAALSMIFAVAYSTLCIVQTRYGLGLPIHDRPKENIIPYTRVNFAGRPIYQMGVSFFKIALCVSYLRLLKRTDQRGYRVMVWAVITLIFIAHLGCTLSLMFACKPVDKSWNPLKKGTCLAPGPSFTGYAAVTITSDIVVAILPIPVLLKLKMPTSKKLGLIGIFLLGLFTTVCSILRYSQIGRIQYGDGNSTMLILWGTIEFNVGNMVSSLPFLAPVFLRKAKEYRSKNSYNNVYASPDHSRESSGKAEDEMACLGHGNSGGKDADRKSSLNHGPDATREKTHNVSGWNAAPGDGVEVAHLEGSRPHFGIFKSVRYSVRVDDGVLDDRYDRRGDIA